MSIKHLIDHAIEAGKSAERCRIWAQNWHERASEAERDGDLRARKYRHRAHRWESHVANYTAESQAKRDEATQRYMDAAGLSKGDAA